MRPKNLLNSIQLVWRCRSLHGGQESKFSSGTRIRYAKIFANEKGTTATAVFNTIRYASSRTIEIEDDNFPQC